MVSFLFLSAVKDGVDNGRYDDDSLHHQLPVGADIEKVPVSYTHLLFPSSNQVICIYLSLFFVYTFIRVVIYYHNYIYFSRGI